VVKLPSLQHGVFTLKNGGFEYLDGEIICNSGVSWDCSAVIECKIYSRELLSHINFTMSLVSPNNTSGANDEVRPRTSHGCRRLKERERERDEGEKEKEIDERENINVMEK